MEDQNMAKHVLIAFDDSENALRAVKFVGSHLSNECHVTLFSVYQDTETLCAMQSPELTAYFMEQKSAFCALEDKKKELLKVALKRAKNHLIDFGFDQKNVKIMSNKRVKGIARDIIAEANKGPYDLIVVGKKGHSGIKEFFLGSISNKVIHSVHKSTVLLVD